MSEKTGRIFSVLSKKTVLIIVSVILCLAILFALAVLLANAHVKAATSDRILSPESAAELEGFDCILVLGCLVKSDGSPSDMLSDRLRRGVELYGLGAAPKLLMSGDHGQKDYNEVEAMKRYAVDAGVPSSDVFMDHAGFSTYESVYRAGKIFEAEKIIIVTQGYHLPRALYIAEALGIEAYGVASDYRSYRGQLMRDMREVLARAKDLVASQIKPKPTYLGESIPVSGDGDLTND